MSFKIWLIGIAAITSLSIPTLAFLRQLSALIRCKFIKMFNFWNLCWLSFHAYNFLSRLSLTDIWSVLSLLYSPVCEKSSNGGIIDCTNSSCFWCLVVLIQTFMVVERSSNCSTFFAYLTFMPLEALGRGALLLPSNMAKKSFKVCFPWSRNIIPAPTTQVGDIQCQNLSRKKVYHRNHPKCFQAIRVRSSVLCVLFKISIFGGFGCGAFSSASHSLSLGGTNQTFNGSTDVPLFIANNWCTSNVI